MIFLLRSVFILIFSVHLLTHAQDTLPTIQIGKQIWMAKNLEVLTFRNGDTIEEVKTKEEWIKYGEEKRPAWCYYNNKLENGLKYGKLYNWYAVNDPRGLAPEGFHIPSYTEWHVLVEYSGGYLDAAINLKSKHGWFEEKNGNDTLKFSALAGGYRSNGHFGVLGGGGFWWTYSNESIEEARYYAVYYYNDVNSYISPKGAGHSVRCIKD